MCVKERFYKMKSIAFIFLNKKKIIKAAQKEILKYNKRSQFPQKETGIRTTSSPDTLSP